MPVLKSVHGYVHEVDTDKNIIHLAGDDAGEYELDPVLEFDEDDWVNLINREVQLTLSDNVVKRVTPVNSN